MAIAIEERQTVAREIGTTVRHSVVYGLGSVAVKGLGFLMIPFYTHYLTPGDYGILEILDLSISLLGMLLNMGITAALLRSYAAAKSSEEKRKVASTAFIFAAVTGAVFLAAAVALVRPASRMILGPAVPSKYLLLSLASFAFGYVANLPRTYLRALDASGAFVMIDIAALFLSLSLNIYFIAGLKMGLVGILLSALIVVGLQLIVLSAWMLHRAGVAFSRGLLREMVAFGLPLILSNLAMFTLNFSDRFFLQHLRSLDVVGIYAVGYKFGFMMNYLLVQPFYVMWQSRMYAVHQHPDHPKIFSQIFSLYSGVLAYAALGLAILSPEIIQTMVDVKFRSSEAIIPIVGAAYVFYGIGYCAQAGMYVTGKTQLVGVISTIAAVLNLGFNYLLIRHFGMVGAAWATLLSFAAMAVGSYYLSQKALRLPLAAGRVTCLLAIGAGFYVATCLWTPESLVTALVFKGILLVAFPIVLWKLRIFSTAEMETLEAAKTSLYAAVFRRPGAAAKAVSV